LGSARRGSIPLAVANGHVNIRRRAAEDCGVFALQGAREGPAVFLPRGRPLASQGIPFGAAGDCSVRAVRGGRDGSAFNVFKQSLGCTGYVDTHSGCRLYGCVVHIAEADEAIVGDCQFEAIVSDTNFEAASLWLQLVRPRMFWCFAATSTHPSDACVRLRRARRRGNRIPKRQHQLCWCGTSDEDRKRRRGAGAEVRLKVAEPCQGGYDCPTLGVGTWQGGSRSPPVPPLPRSLPAASLQAPPPFGAPRRAGLAHHRLPGLGFC